MKKSLMLSLAIFSTAGLSSAFQVSAQPFGQGFSINPGAGYYNFDSDINIENDAFPAIGLEYRFTKNVALELNYLQAESEFENTQDDFDWQQYRLDGLYYFSPNNKFQPFISGGAGENSFDFSTGDDKETVADLGAGFKYFVNNPLSFRGDVRAINSLDNETTSSAAVLGLNLLLGGNGLGGKTEDIDLALSETTDADNDGIFDAQDDCPNTPSDASIDNRGCPLDSDSDGIADYQDNCAETAAGIAVDEFGCANDMDNDGIANASDLCANTPQDLMVDDSGCPINIEETVSIDLDVNFPLNSAKLPEQFVSDVKELATFMRLYEDTIATIEGHADATGTEPYNKALSEKRAETIRNILVQEFDIDESRLQTVGYGESRPVASNNTLEGRKKNRRAATLVNTNISVSQPAANTEEK